MPTQEINAAFVTDIMERLYSQRPHMERLGGGVNMHVYAASFGDGAEDKVIKLAGEGQWKPWAVLDEEAVMRALCKQGISEVPEADKITSGFCPLRPNNCRAADRHK
ncbi:MAG: hypothetical protein NT075_28605 [Chloroflexi bacterium]|nr:hypothetical protein [Chloroflexota bacterium]